MRVIPQGETPKKGGLETSASLASP